VAKRGRRALDEGKRREVVAILSVGCSQNTAAKYVGCTPQTIRREGDRDAAFGAAIRQAKCNAELGLVKSIRNAAKKEQYWRAAAWALERLFPEKYARRGPDVITTEQLAQILAQIAEMIVVQAPADKYRKKMVKGVEAIARGLGYSIRKEAAEHGEESEKQEPPSNSRRPTISERPKNNAEKRPNRQHGEKQAKRPRRRRGPR